MSLLPCLYTGTHQPHWLWSGAVPADCCLFVSHRALARYKTFRSASVRGWALDSGGFTELAMHGRWQTTARDYTAAVARYDREIGRLEWAAIQDWMCEATIRAATGLTVAEHQERSVASYAELAGLWPEYSDAECPFMPVLQAAPGDGEGYLRHAAMYEVAGIRLADFPVVGVGSVCRVQSTRLVTRVAEALWSLDLALHFFGVKSSGLPLIWPPDDRAESLTSLDSMAWSYAARRRPPMPGCTTHANCANCPKAALAWRSHVQHQIRCLHRHGRQPLLSGGRAEASLSGTGAQGHMRKEA
jgi:hypothetical protein